MYSLVIDLAIKALLGLATKTIDNFLERIAKLYEQGAFDLPIRNYVWRWIK